MYEPHTFTRCPSLNTIVCFVAGRRDAVAAPSSDWCTFLKKGIFMCRNSFTSWRLQLTGQSYGRGGVYVHIRPRQTWWCHQQAPPNQYCSSVSSFVIGSLVNGWWSFGGFKAFYFSDVRCGTPLVLWHAIDLCDYWLLVTDWELFCEAAEHKVFVWNAPHESNQLLWNSFWHFEFFRSQFRLHLNNNSSENVFLVEVDIWTCLSWCVEGTWESGLSLRPQRRRGRWWHHRHVLTVSHRFHSTETFQGVLKTKCLSLCPSPASSLRPLPALCCVQVSSDGRVGNMLTLPCFLYTEITAPKTVSCFSPTSSERHAVVQDSLLVSSVQTDIINQDSFYLNIFKLMILQSCWFSPESFILV